jgi:hypothetical protein
MTQPRYEVALHHVFFIFFFFFGLLAMMCIPSGVMIPRQG